MLRSLSFMGLMSAVGFSLLGCNKSHSDANTESVKTDGGSVYIEFEDDPAQRGRDTWSLSARFTAHLGQGDSTLAEKVSRRFKENLELFVWQIAPGDTQILSKFEYVVKKKEDAKYVMRLGFGMFKADAPSDDCSMAISVTVTLKNPKSEVVHTVSQTMGRHSVSRADCSAAIDRWRATSSYDESLHWPEFDFSNFTPERISQSYMLSALYDAIRQIPTH